jgi:hypothetical protein
LTPRAAARIVGDVAEVVPLRPARRALFVDERGAGLRATWHAEAGLVVVSVWREDVCVATVHLDVDDVGRLAAFLATAGR